VDIGLPMTIQANRFLGVDGGILTGRRRPFGSNQANGDTGSNNDTYPPFFAHQTYVPSPRTKASVVLDIFDAYGGRSDVP
jgi:hypothetical protein